ncbi:hypothetical protein NDU88_003531 [Pleurodeles waltl]|uniref:DDE Tnp4 domain-containing protein n=1 Tax=Pleurodeles waltl TaxID=8319 RepID=A0AAV7TQW1_PLEWA|nr:hypothetical protein NDU88_003531 [Pleurodeles waltl]
MQPLRMNRKWRHPSEYRPLVDLATMQDKHIILTCRRDRATITELCAQSEPDLISAIPHPTGIPPSCASAISSPFPGDWFFPSDSGLGSRNVTANVLNSADQSVVTQVEDLATVKSDIYAMGHIPNIIGAIDWTHIAFVPPQQNEQLFRNRKSYHLMNVQMVCMVDHYISHVNAKYSGSVHDAFILRKSSIPNVMAQLQRLIGGSLCYSPKKVCQIIVACCMMHNLAMRRHVPSLQEEEAGDGRVAAVDPVDSEDEEAEDEDSRSAVIRQYFQ